MAFRFTGQPTPTTASSSVANALSLPNLAVINGLPLNQVNQIYQPPAQTTTNTTLEELVKSPNTQITNVLLNNLINPIEQSAISCIQQMIATVIYFKNTITNLFNGLSNVRHTTYDELKDSTKHQVEDEINNLLQTKINLGVSSQMMQNILNEINIVCTNASPVALKQYTDNALNINIAASKTATNAVNSISKQLINEPPVSLNWLSLI